MDRYKGLTLEERADHYLKEYELTSHATDSQIAFLGSPLPLRMGITLIGGCTGRGKSTASANVLADFYIRYPDRRALAITNEELSADVLDRISCIILNEDFYKHRDRSLKTEQSQRIKTCSFELMKRIIVVSTQSRDMSCLEDVIDMLNMAHENSFNLVIVDYLQTIIWSQMSPHLTQYEVSKKLGLYLKEYGRQVTIPVLLFAQLKPLSPKDMKEQSLPDFTTRVQGDQTFINHAVMVIEIIPDFENKRAQFYIHKDRFGKLMNQAFRFSWNNGILTQQNL